MGCGGSDVYGALNLTYQAYLAKRANGEELAEDDLFDLEADLASAVALADYSELGLYQENEGEKDIVARCLELAVEEAVSPVCCKINLLPVDVDPKDEDAFERMTDMMSDLVKETYAAAKAVLDRINPKQ